MALLIIISLSGFSQIDKNSIDDKQEESRKKIKTKKSPENFKDTEVNFLFNYYSQDGDHSPVTGGKGTEKLQNYASAIIIHMVPDSLTSLDIDFGLDVYSSASTDNIDQFRTIYQSSASSKDARGHINIAYNKTIPSTGNQYGINTVFSLESDVRSIGFGGNYTILSNDLNRSVYFGLNYFRDTWRLIYPYELRKSGPWLKDDIRSTFQTSFSVSQIINTRSKFQLTTEPTFQFGLLSTPFHRFYFSNAANKTFEELETLGHVEQLKDKRFRFPIGIRYHYFLNSSVILKTNYRFYVDTWGIAAHTVNLELPMYISPSFIFSPYFRYYIQTKADDFYKFGELDLTSKAKYFTSDYDLSDFESYKIGTGLQYSPVMGIGKFKSPFRKRKVAQFKSVGLRAAYYDRSDGLNAWLVSLDFGFTF